MTLENRIINKESLAKLYNKLRLSSRVFAPINIGKKTVFKYDPDYENVSCEHIQTVQSAKNTVFPVIENLFYFTKDKVETNTDIDLSKVPDVVVWGVHPCDASTFSVLKSIFMWDFKDLLFDTRMKKLTIIGMSCYQSDDSCFCTSVGLNPGATDGSDILLTPLNGDEYLAEILTEKGLQIMNDSPELFLSADNFSKEKNLAKVEKKFDHADVTENLKSLFNSPFWVENSLRCIGCGACAFVCPTCACFDIQDEMKGKNGVRLRCWDSCGFKAFTQHASGHNPRNYQSERWRQRIYHKFSYMPERNDSLGCTGCGRCSRSCPVDMNIQEQLIELSKMEDSDVNKEIN
jgi:sulfhydrogenase subunit beta (sulfur reductase)